MSELYDRIETLCKERNTTITEMCRASGASRGSLTDLKMGRIASLSTETLSKISNFFGVYVSYLLGQSSIVQCEECGAEYDPDNLTSVDVHKARHTAWENAVRKFGFCWTHRYREDAKAKARNKIEQGLIDDDQYIAEQLAIFKALFSRSLEACDYDLSHATFKDYVAMLLYQAHWKREIPPHIYEKLSAKYGAKRGIPSGTYYEIKKRPTPVSESGSSYPPEYDLLSPENKEMVNRLIAELAKQHKSDQ